MCAHQVSIFPTLFSISSESSAALRPRLVLLLQPPPVVYYSLLAGPLLNDILTATHTRRHWMFVGTVSCRTLFTLSHCPCLNWRPFEEQKGHYGLSGQDGQKWRFIVIRRYSRMFICWEEMNAFKIQDIILWWIEMQRRAFFVRSYLSYILISSILKNEGNSCWFLKIRNA